MKKNNINEKNFEVSHFTKMLIDNSNGLYIERKPDDYNQELMLEPDTLLNFVKNTQPKEWDKLKVQYPGNTEKTFLEKVSNEIIKRGTLDVLRNGIEDRGTKFELAYFKPISGLNPEHKSLYEQNKFIVIRQLKYSQKNSKSLDISIFLNGIPIVTVELKNHFTGQNYTDAIRQYKFDRDPRELFLKNCLVHFAVDNDKVYFTTKLVGQNTQFLPFNKDIVNPDDPRGFKVAYLYYDILHPDSLLNIISHFIQSEKKKDNKTGKEVVKIIFPRFHQLATVNQITSSVKSVGVGKNYLIQHSAGSGKTYTISWIAHQLSQIHNNDNNRIFDSVIVVSDRIVIDKQLRDAVQQFEKTKDVVFVAKTSDGLRVALETGKNIVVTTIQKFTVIVDEISEIKGKMFAVIIDEAHSSQSGETSKSVKKTLNYVSLESAESVESGDPEEVDVETEILESIKSRGKSKNVSFFAFTATPKQETLELFGEKLVNGSYEAFSKYSMKQAIEEGFILDVLENYLTYKTYFQLIKKIEDDPEYDKKKATGLLMKYVDLHEHAIRQKTEIMLSHFNKSVKGKIGGRAKAMVVTKSRLHAVRYKLEFDRIINEKKYDYKVLVAFTDKVKDGGKEFTETSMNNIPETQTREKFDTDLYKILIVANKFQTGFDQPLLHTMYVDKKLNNVNAVQTLSRLNRKIPGKDEVYVIDFVNEPDNIQKSFLPYYETTVLAEGTDPNLLYDLKSWIMEPNVIETGEIDEFTRLWVTETDQSKLHKVLMPAVNRYVELSKDGQSVFKDNLRKYIKLYSFVSQIMTFADVTLEKLYLYVRFLLKKLPPDVTTLPKEITDNVDMDSYRLKEIYKGKIDLQGIDNKLVSKKITQKMTVKDDFERLSAILKELNDVYGMNLTDADKVKLASITETIRNNQELKDSVAMNSKPSVKLQFNDLFDEVMGDMYEKDLDFYKKLVDNDKIKEIVKDRIFENIFCFLLNR